MNIELLDILEVFVQVLPYLSTGALIGSTVLQVLRKFRLGGWRTVVILFGVTVFGFLLRSGVGHFESNRVCSSIQCAPTTATVVPSMDEIVAQATGGTSSDSPLFPTETDIQHITQIIDAIYRAQVIRGAPIPDQVPNDLDRDMVAMFRRIPEEARGQFMQDLDDLQQRANNPRNYGINPVEDATRLGWDYYMQGVRETLLQDYISGSPYIRGHAVELLSSINEVTFANNGLPPTGYVGSIEGHLVLVDAEFNQLSSSSSISPLLASSRQLDQLRVRYNLVPLGDPHYMGFSLSDASSVEHIRELHRVLATSNEELEAFAFFLGYDALTTGAHPETRSADINKLFLYYQHLIDYAAPMGIEFLDATDAEYEAYVRDSISELVPLEQSLALLSFSDLIVVDGSESLSDEPIPSEEWNARFKDFISSLESVTGIGVSDIYYSN